MKKKFCFSVLLSLWMGSGICAAPSDCYWIHCWMTGIELSKSRNNHPEALKAYTAAIQNQKNSQAPQHFYLYNERAKLYLKMQDYHQAIQDFSFVLSHDEASKEEILDALWGRGQAYLATGKTQEFDKDRKRLDELEPFITPLEDHEDYLILKMGSHVSRDPESQERLIKVFLMQKKIKSKQDVVFTPSGLAIVKKSKSFSH